MKYKYWIMLTFSIIVSASFLSAVADNHHILPTLLQRIREQKLPEIKKIIRSHKNSFSRSDIAHIKNEYRLTSSRTSRFCRHSLWGVEDLYGMMHIIIPFLSFVTIMLHYSVDEVYPVLDQSRVFAKDPIQRITHFNVFGSYILHYASRLFNVGKRCVKYAFATYLAMEIPRAIYELACNRYIRYPYKKFRFISRFMRREFPEAVPNC